jgi:hypothetical protein
VKKSWRLVMVFSYFKHTAKIAPKLTKYPQHPQHIDRALTQIDRLDDSVEKPAAQRTSLLESQKKQHKKIAPSLYSLSDCLFLMDIIWSCFCRFGPICRAPFFLEEEVSDFKSGAIFG